MLYSARSLLLLSRLSRLLLLACTDERWYAKSLRLLSASALTLRQLARCWPSASFSCTFCAGCTRGACDLHPLHAGAETRAVSMLPATGPARPCTSEATRSVRSVQRLCCSYSILHALRDGLLRGCQVRMPLRSPSRAPPSMFTPPLFCSLTWQPAGNETGRLNLPMSALGALLFFYGSLHQWRCHAILGRMATPSTGSGAGVRPAEKRHMRASETEEQRPQAPTTLLAATGSTSTPARITW